MSLNKKLDKLFEQDFKKIEEEELEEENITGGGEAHDTKYAFGKKTDDETSEKSGYKKMKESTRKTLEDFFKPYNERLYKLLGQNFSWD